MEGLSVKTVKEQMNDFNPNISSDIFLDDTARKKFIEVLIGNIKNIEQSKTILQENLKQIELQLKNYKDSLELLSKIDRFMDSDGLLLLREFFEQHAKEIEEANKERVNDTSI